MLDVMVVKECRFSIHTAVDWTVNELDRRTGEMLLLAGIMIPNPAEVPVVPGGTIVPGTEVIK